MVRSRWTPTRAGLLARRSCGRRGAPMWVSRWTFPWSTLAPSATTRSRWIGEASTRVGRRPRRPRCFSSFGRAGRAVHCPSGRGGRRPPPPEAPRCGDVPGGTPGRAVAPEADELEEWLARVCSACWAGPSPPVGWWREASSPAGGSTVWECAGRQARKGCGAGGGGAGVATGLGEACWAGRSLPGCGGRRSPQPEAPRCGNMPGGTRKRAPSQGTPAVAPVLGRGLRW